ncbi:MAG TPA: glutaredoxin domain-containing protein [Candidatus Nanoarchaeia archaeon]|nr:glutaredoxin domain-containing protein [Candidatus Nanoarchaeia archaeon]
MTKLTVKVYSTPSCPWCTKAKEFFTAKKIKFDDINVAEDEKARSEMLEKTGQMGVPVIEIAKQGEDPVIIVGFDQEAIEEAIS